jgi:hypothetical protein
MLMDASLRDSKMNIRGQQHVGVVTCSEIGCDVYMISKGMSAGPMKAQPQKMGNGNEEVATEFPPQPNIMEYVVGIAQEIPLTLS